jgi:hypothetical protein
MNSSNTYEETQLQDREPESLQAIFIESYEKCGFCGSKLIFTHDMNLSFLQVIEVARCPGCGVTMNPKKFTLQ